MKITKYGHCCMLIEDQGVRILTDPGMFSSEQDSIKNIDLILITHEHLDHFHIPSLKNVLTNNPLARVITNDSVGKLLDVENIKYELVEHGQKVTIKNVLIEGYGEKHAQMHSSIPQSSNTGYFISSRLFYPGDAFTHPNKSVDILALPVAGPWMKLSEAIDYALVLHPKITFPVHDGILNSPGVFHRLPKEVLESKGIPFMILPLNKETEL